MQHEVVDQNQWLLVQAEFLNKEKELTRMRDEVAAQRRTLPWTRIEKQYEFATPRGRQSLAALFDGKSQLFVQHFMFGPGWKEGCPGCSFLADHFNAALVHLIQRDVNFVAVSRAPLNELLAFQKRMGWTFPWVSSHGSDFNFDFHVSYTPQQVEEKEGMYNFAPSDVTGEEAPGASIFYKNEQGEVFRTYSSYARGCETMLTTYMALDLLPKGRDEAGYKVHPMEWVRLHDQYDSKKSDGHCCE